METIAQRHGLNAVAAHKVTGLAAVRSPHVIESSELIGIEVEVENAGAEAQRGGLNRAWMVKGDGSLRNEGYEFVSRPIAANQAPDALEYLLKSYLSDNCCFSPRTSVHIHLNVQDLTSAQVLDYLLIYAIYERLLYKLVGRSRMKNIYCVPLCDTDLLPYLCENGETRGGRWSKYTGLNTLPITSFGTIEYRHMHGTFDVEKLCVWINLITQLKEYIKRTPTKEIRAMIASMDDGFDFEKLGTAVFGAYFKFLKYESVLEMNYLQSKQALSSAENGTRIRRSATTASAFYKFRG